MAFLNLGPTLKFYAYVLSFHPYKTDLNQRSTAPDMTQLPSSVPVWTKSASLF
jgi:hypothetical protein